MSTASTWILTTTPTSSASSTSHIPDLPCSTSAFKRLSSSTLPDVHPRFPFVACAKEMAATYQRDSPRSSISTSPMPETSF
ncbi:Protein CBG17144 [Caenorhabditis briggsae]|nr:Protein CBG17144 [Caenorhabditis briggsae]ULT81416.1 hypothetical protein L3Y34_011364 [Caenorhabditis briggsae]CAP34964.2 Protein CBG17144 [Caenorhabditis briggsae]